MCLGVVMTVVKGDDVRATVAWEGDQRVVSMALVGAQPPGTEVLIHLDMAMRVVDAEEARLMRDAIRGLVAAQRGESFEHLFADLIDREPTLPPHLQEQHSATEHEEGADR